MADLENKVDKLDSRVMTLEQQVSNVMTKLDMFIEESRAARERHDAEIRELRQRQDAAQAKHDADIREMREKHDADMKEMQKNIYAKMDNMDAKIERMGESNRNMFIVTMIGIAAMVVAVFLK